MFPIAAIKGVLSPALAGRSGFVTSEKPAKTAKTA